MMLVVAAALFTTICRCSGLNVAYGKHAWQSSQYQSSVASNAVDGSLKSSESGCAITDCQKNPWWIVDLDGLFFAPKAFIYNRYQCGERLVNYTLEISRDAPVGDNFSKFKLCQHNANAADKAEKILMTCPEPLFGRYLKIQIYLDDCGRSGCTGSLLQICEVEVFARGVDRNKFARMKNARASGRNLENVFARSRMECGAMCVRIPQCTSFNTMKVTNGVECELLDEIDSGTSAPNGPPTAGTEWDHYY